MSLLSDLVTQPTQRGLQPEDWKGQRQNLRCIHSDQAHQHNRHCTATPRHFWSNSGVGQGFLCVVSLWLWVMWVGLWHSRLKSLPQDPKKGVDMQRGVRDFPETESQKVQSTWPAESGWTSEGFWQFAHKVQSTWPVQCGRTSEGFWKSSRTGLCHPARAKSSGKVAQTI